MIILLTKKTAKQILDYLNSDEKLDLQVRLFISALNSHTFTEQQHRIVDIVEKEIEQEIPEETKQTIYSKCNDEKQDFNSAFLYCKIIMIKRKRRW